LKNTILHQKKENIGALIMSKICFDADHFLKGVALCVLFLSMFFVLVISLLAFNKKDLQILRRTPPRHGPSGMDGDDGFDGVDGVDGLSGRDGMDGMDGINGKDGVNGVMGPRGDTGDPGETGPRGPRGSGTEIIEKVVHVLEVDLDSLREWKRRLTGEIR
jgi:hypothetical protein